MTRPIRRSGDAAGGEDVDADADVTCGLRDVEVAQRLAADGPNELPRPREPTVPERLARHVVEPLSAILVVAALASGVLLGRWLEAMAIGAIVVLNAVIATVQERRSAAAIRALEAMVAPTARVRRDGVDQVVPAASLVVGDLVEITPGDRVPADLRLVGAVRLGIDEAMLTGEAWPADKRVTTSEPGTPLADRAGEAWAGTLVVRGHGRGVVTATGARTQVGRIAGGLEGASAPPLIGELRVLASRLAAVSIAVGAAIIPLMWWHLEEDRVAVAVLTGVALAVAAIPEGMPTIVVAALAIGARRMARRGAIVVDLAAIEGLGSADVICTDKTGTLTTGHLTVTDAVASPGLEDELWVGCRRCNDARDGVGDPVDVALHAAADERGAPTSVGRRVGEHPYDPVARTMTTVHETGGGVVLTVKGAPEVVLARCAPGPELDRLRRAADRLARDGAKVLAVAERDGASGLGDDGALVPLGVVAFTDPVRPSAVVAVEQCRRAGVRVVLVTGDHLGTAVAVARAVGIATARCVSGDQLAGLDPARRRSTLASADVVARVDPATKVELVDALRAGGHVVSMTGDGVNDAPALQRADVGVALAGEGGTDVARHAAQLVVTDGDLGTITQAMGEGRQVRRNLEAVVAYLVTGNLSGILVVAIGVLLLTDLDVPMLPVQLLWVNLVNDGLPALALGADRPVGHPLAQPRRAASLLAPSMLRRAVVVACGVAALVLGSAALASGLGWSDDVIRAQLLLTLLCARLLLALVVRASRWTFERGWATGGVVPVAVVGSALVQVAAFATPAGRALLGLGALPPAGWLIALGATLVLLVGVEAGRALARTRRQGSSRNETAASSASS